MGLARSCLTPSLTLTHTLTLPPASLPAPPRCSQIPGTTPYYVLPSARVEPGRTAATTAYCFTLAMVPAQYRIEVRRGQWGAAGALAVAGGRCY